MNQFTLELIHKFPGIFTEQTFTGLQTFPSQQFYNLQANIRKINTVYINVGGSSGFNWPVKECPTEQFWDNLNMTNNITSDIPQYFFFRNNQLGLYPRPASGYNPITITGQVEVTSISVADYTTGTITTAPYPLTLTGTLVIGALAATLNATFGLPTGTYQLTTSGGDTVLALFTNGSTAITWTKALIHTGTTATTLKTANGGDILTGTTTVWTTAMQGFVFQIAQPTGDNFWYRIETVYDNTHLSLTTPYNGANLAAASAAYLIGQTSLIPKAYQTIPIFRAAELYYTVIVESEVKQGKYKSLADIAEANLKTDYGNKDTNPTVEDNFGKSLINPNLAINISDSGANQ